MCEFTEKVAAAEAAVPATTLDEARALHQTGRAIFIDPRPDGAIVETTGLIPGALLLMQVTRPNVRA